MVISDDFTDFFFGPSSRSRFLDKIHHINWHKPLTSRHHSSSTFNSRCADLQDVAIAAIAKLPGPRAQSTAWLLSNIFNMVCSCCLKIFDWRIRESKNPSKSIFIPDILNMHEYAPRSKQVCWGLFSTKCRHVIVFKAYCGC